MKYHQDFVLDKIYSTDWSTTTEAPLVVELDPTQACDLACPGCISEDIMKGNDRFSNERLLTLADELYQAGVKAVILIGGGEPLAHPAVGELIEFLGTHDIHIGITTNGTMIGKYLDLISEYSSWTRVSMDAGSDKLFNLLRPSKGGKSKFDHIIKNMENLAAVKKGKLGYSYLIQTSADGIPIDSNIDEIVLAGRLAKDIGCDYFEVKPTYQFRGDAVHALMKHPQALMERAKEAIAQLNEIEDENFSVIKAINLEYSLNSEVELQPKPYHTCPAAQLRTLITPSGIFVCPYWRGKDHMRIGDALQSNFVDIWHGDRRRSVMKKLDPSIFCTFHCLRHDSNMEVLRIIDAKMKGNRISAVPEYDRFL